MKIELSEPDTLVNMRPADLINVFRQREDYGFDGVGIPDLMIHGLDTYTFFAAAAMQTSKITMFPNIGNPITRHPWVLANICATLGHIAPGRFRMNLAAGTTYYLGRPPARVAEMRDAVLTMRQLLAGDPLSLAPGQSEAGYTAKSLTADSDYGTVLSDRYDFDSFYKGGLIRPPREKENIPPIGMSVGGPRMIELSGEVADEVTFLTGHDGQTIAAAKKLIKSGAKRSGRSLDGFKMGHWAVCYVDDHDEDAAYDLVWRTFYAGLPIGTHLNHLTMEALGFDWDMKRLGDIPVKERRRFIDATGFVGPAEKIAERIQDVKRAGELDRLVIRIMGPNQELAVNDVARIVLPRVK